MRATHAATLAALLVLPLSACTTAQLRMPEGFAADAAVYEVSGH